MSKLIGQGEGRFRIKSFWERSEGTVGMVVLASIAVAGGFVLYHMLPSLIRLLENTIYAGVLAGIIALVVAALANARFRTLMAFMFQSAMRKLTSVFIVIDPIGILKSFVERQKKNLVELAQSVTDLSGIERGLQNEIAKNKAESDRLTQLLVVAKERLNGANARETSELRNANIVNARQIGRLQESNANYSDLLGRTQALRQVLEKCRDVSSVVIEDLQNEIKNEERKREISKTAYRGMQRAKRILRGEAAGQALYDETMEHLVHSYDMRIGAIEDFVRSAQGFMTSVDLQNGVYEQNAMKMLAELETRGEAILENNGERKSLGNSPSPSLPAQFGRAGDTVARTPSKDGESGHWF